MSAVVISVTALGVVLLASLAMIIIASRQGRRPGRGGVVTASLGMALWCSGLIAQLSSRDPRTKEALGGLVYLGICVGVLGIAHGLTELAGRPRIPRWVWALIAVPGVVTPVLVTTGWHDLVLRNVRAPAATGPLTSESGPWFFLHTVWAYSLLVGSLLMFALVAQNAPAPLRRQAHLIAAAMAAPLLANVVFISGLVDTGAYDPTPYTLIFSIIALAWAVLRGRLIEGQIGMVGLARDQVVEAMPDPVLTLDRDDRVLDLNPAALALVDAPFPPLGTSVRDLLPGWPGPDGREDAADGATFEHDGRTLDIAARTVGGGAGLVRVAVLRDATARERDVRTTREEAVVDRHRATHDDMTGLPNRGRVFAQLEALLTHGRDAAPFALLVLDLDGFKSLNDSFGHRAGDDVLRELSARITAVADDTALVGRLGGDEFAVVMPGADDTAARAMAQRMVEAVRVAFTVGDADIRLGGSVGVALAPQHGSDADTLMHAADVAMYDAKRERRGIAVYTTTQGQRRPGRLVMGAELREAVGRDEIEVHYQTQMDGDGHVVGLEALARWRHPRRGLLLPADFLPLAEDSALITDITDHVLESALRDAGAWLAEHPGVGVSVNLADRDLRDPRLTRRIADALDSSGIDADRLTLEVTENALITARETSAHLAELRDIGVRLSLDDFGTGFAPLATLRHLAVDELKIDRSFVSGMDTRDAALIRALLNFGHELGLVIVAEGVEKPGERDELHRLRCDVMQGFLFSRPRPVDEVDFSRRPASRSAEASPR